jgi:hypothetical protein
MYAGLFCHKMFVSELEVSMQKWPYADFGYLGVEQLHFLLGKNISAQQREYLTLEAVFPVGSETAVQFFDHYTKEYKGQRSEFDAYLEKLSADGWKLTVAGNFFLGKGYRFKQYHFRRVIG